MMNNEYTLLLVDDDENYRTTILLVLKKYFKNIDVAVNLEEALKLLNNNKYDIVITDGVFPKVGNYRIKNPTSEDVNGIILASAAKKKGIYVIGISSDPKLLGNIPDVTLKKPFNLTDLQGIIKKRLGI
ncbi:MAG: response regulator [Candidatus Woesearchaeota archaeon]